MCLTSCFVESHRSLRYDYVLASLGLNEDLLISRSSRSIRSSHSWAFLLIICPASVRDITASCSISLAEKIFGAIFKSRHAVRLLRLQLVPMLAT